MRGTTEGAGEQETRTRAGGSPLATAPTEEYAKASLALARFWSDEWNRVDVVAAVQRGGQQQEQQQSDDGISQVRIPYATLLAGEADPVLRARRIASFCRAHAVREDRFERWLDGRRPGGAPFATVAAWIHRTFGEPVLTELAGPGWPVMVRRARRTRPDPPARVTVAPIAPTENPLPPRRHRTHDRHHHPPRPEKERSDGEGGATGKKPSPPPQDDGEGREREGEETGLDGARYVGWMRSVESHLNGKASAEGNPHRMAFVAAVASRERANAERLSARFARDEPLRWRAHATWELRAPLVRKRLERDLQLDGTDLLALDALLRTHMPKPGLDRPRRARAS